MLFLASNYFTLASRLLLFDLSISSAFFLVHVLDVLEAMTQPEGDRLLAQVGQLPAGDLVVVHIRGAGLQAGFERRVGASILPPARLSPLRTRCRPLQ